MDYLNYDKGDISKPNKTLKGVDIPEDTSLKDVANILYATPFWHFAKELPPNAHEWALWYKEQYECVQVSNRGGYQSPSRPWQEFEFKDHISSMLSNFKEFKNFYITNWWLNVNGKGNGNNKHVHSGVDLSAVWYITDNEGLLVFEDPLVFSRLAITHKIFGSTTLQQVKAHAGDLLIFPADLPHQVEDHKLDTPRISVSFNIALGGD